MGVTDSGSEFLPISPGYDNFRVCLYTLAWMIEICFHETHHFDKVVVLQLLHFRLVV